MYLRRCYRAKDGKRHAYWALVKSVRTVRGPRQQVVAYLGEMDEAGRVGIRQAAQGNRPDPQGQFFEPAPIRWVEVDPQRVRVENGRAFGGAWLGLQILRRLGLTEFLERRIEPGREDVPWPMMAWVLVLARLCEPSSELHIAEDFYEHSAIADLLGVPAAKVNDDRLYRTLDAILPHKASLEKHLKGRLGDLFDLEYDLLLYDVTSTCFEGAANANPLARRGYSRDHRGDCKQVCIGLVVTPEGIPIGYEVFAGNRTDVTTLEEIVTTMESLSEGCYLLRSNVKDWTGEELWRAYMQLAEGAEGAFRIQKSDLDLRPIWHQKPQRVKAHILVCFLTYVIWKTLGQMCREAGLGDEPRKVLEEIGRIPVVDVVMPTSAGIEIRKRCVQRPTAHQAILLERLGLHLPQRLEMVEM